MGVVEFVLDVLMWMGIGLVSCVCVVCYGWILVRVIKYFFGRKRK